MGKRMKKAGRKAGWRQWTADEARQVVEAWRASGLPLATYARRRRLCPERIRWWRARLGEWQGPAPEARRQLTPVVVVGDGVAAAAAPVASVTVRAPGDVTIEIADVGAVSAEWLGALVTGLTRRAAA